MESLRVNFERNFAANNLSEVKGLLESAEVKVTFWGGRVLTVQGYSGSITLDEVARKTLEVGIRTLENDDAPQICLASLSKRLEDAKTCETIQRLYIQSNEQIRQSNFFTRLLNYIREFQPECTRGSHLFSSLPTIFVHQIQSVQGPCFFNFSEKNEEIVRQRLLMSPMLRDPETNKRLVTGTFSKERLEELQRRMVAS